MKFVRIGAPGQESPGVIDGTGTVRDLRGITRDIDGEFLSGPGLNEARAALRDGLLPPLPPGRLGAPIASPGKVVGIGMNYTCHAASAGVDVPPEPILFLKASSSIVGPADSIRVPAGSRQTDWEAELGVVLGSRLRHCDDPRQALSAVAAYVAADDVTEREHAAYGPTWAKGKSHDTFCPLGPWLVTADEVDDVQDLDVRLWVNGEQRQSSSTARMAFRVGELLAYASRHMTLEPGDVLLTGTPGGVAGQQPHLAPYLTPGDLVELEISGLGRQRTPVVGADGDVEDSTDPSSARARRPEKETSR